MNVSRDTLTAYLLGTLSDADRARVDAALAESAELRERLEALRRDIDRLDDLPDTTPSRDLVDPVLERIAAGAGDRPPTRFGAPQIVRIAVFATTLAIMAGALAAAFHAIRVETHNAFVQNSLKQLGLAMKMYASENNGAYPPVAPYPGVWTFDLRVLYPDYMNDPNTLVNPKLPDAPELRRRLHAALEAPEPDWETAMRIVAKSYIYTGHVIRNDEDATFLAQQVAAGWPATDPDVAEQIQARLHPPREGVERFFITDINNPAAGAFVQSDLPLIFEAPPPGKQRPRPICVLYMDGHVMTVYPGQGYPASPGALELIQSPANDD